MNTTMQKVRFERDGNSSRFLIMGTYSYFDTFVEKHRRKDIVLGVVSDLWESDRASESLMETPAEFDNHRRYLVVIFNQPRNLETSGPASFECRANFAHRRTRGQALDFVKEYFGVIDSEYLNGDHD